MEHTKETILEFLGQFLDENGLYSKFEHWLEHRHGLLPVDLGMEE